MQVSLAQHGCRRGGRLPQQLLQLRLRLKLSLSLRLRLRLTSRLVPRTLRSCWRRCSGPQAEQIHNTDSLGKRRQERCGGFLVYG